MFRIVALLLLVCSFFITSGQSLSTIKMDGYFHKDTVVIGEDIPFSLWIIYPREQDVVFPDSTYNFSPFELGQKEYYQTRSDSINSVDSVIYHFSTFEIDTIQFLSIPIYLLTNSDSLILDTRLDSVVLQQLVTSIPDSVSMKVNTSYIKVPLQFNYPYYLLGLIIVLALLLLVALIFGKRIKKWIFLYRIKRRHERFLKVFDAESMAGTNAEHILAIWKKYMQRLSETPFSSLTTKEIIERVKNESLSQTLQEADRLIYGNDPTIEQTKICGALKQYSVYTFEDKIRQLKYE